MKQKTIQIGKKLDGFRLDIALVNAGLGMSRRKIRRIIDIGGAYLNNKRVRVASRQVRDGDKIRLEYQDEQVRKLKPKKFVLRAEDILFENERVIVINKPAGLPSQATRDQSIMHVVPVLKRYYQDQGTDLSTQLILVHRLDKETSGVLIVAKDEAVATYLTDQFRAKTIKKTYVAACYGIPQKAQFEFECYLSAIQAKTGVVRQVRSGGKKSHTKFAAQSSNKKLNVSLIGCFPSTGRSHQLRVHLDLNNLPIIGDKKYGERQRTNLPDELATLAAEHHLLHCERMSFKWSEQEPPVEVFAPWPENLAKFSELAFSNTH